MRVDSYPSDLKHSLRFSFIHDESLEKRARVCWDNDPTMSTNCMLAFVHVVNAKSYRAMQ